MNRVGKPALISSVIAPLGLTGGWWVSQLLWPGYDPIRQTVSELAAGDAPTRFFMNAVFVLAGVSHIVTAVYGRVVAPAGRLMLGFAGLASIAVAFFPLPTAASISIPHRIVAVMSFIGLALWPALGWRRHTPWPILRPTVMIGSALFLLGLCSAFFIIWSDRSGITGLAERYALVAESTFPAVVMWSARRSRHVRVHERMET